MSWKQNIKVAMPVLRNKYAITIIGFAVWMLFVDQNSFIDRVNLINNIRNLKRQKENVIAEIISNRDNINELESSPDNLEKFAREEYLMKKPDEDLFIVVEE
ncbi:MAG: septum formation initiator family protein [Cytophagaceae bacterium]|nr:septum formation initiator family protein [Cytophagaceae bacterium]